MYDVSAQFLHAIRSSHVREVKVRHHNLITNVWTDLEVEDGSVRIDATASIRRTLDLTLPPREATYQVLDTPGGEITVSQAVRFVNGTRETVPLGVFIVDADKMGYQPNDSLTLTCPDRWLKVQRNRFGLNRASVPGNAAWEEIQRLVEDCWGGSYPFPGWAHVDTTATTKVGPLIWDDGDREAAIKQLCRDNAVQVFFDENGEGVLRPIPTLSDTSTPVFTVDAGATGVMVAADRSRDRSQLHNAIILTTSATDVTFDPVEVKNTTPGDPLNVSGPLGYVPLEYSSPTLRNSTQARAAGVKMLGQQLGTAKQLEIESFGNFALDGEDIITVRLPRTDLNLPRPVELHIIDAITNPFQPGTTQQIQTRSTRPDTDGEEA